jgi:hypothetical protein
VRLFLLQAAANLGGSDVTWKTVLEMYPFPFSLFPELTIYSVGNAEQCLVIDHREVFIKDRTKISKIRNTEFSKIKEEFSEIPF